MGIFIFSINYVVSTNVDVISYEVLLFSIFTIFIFLGILVFKEKENLLKIDHKYKLQKEYIKNIEAINNVIRREKHDFSNHINTIHAMCILNKTNTIERIKLYLDKLSTNLKTSYHYYNSGNDYIDGLLAVKSNIAFNKCIHLDIDFEILLNTLSIDSYDLIGIVSNIIDNSFDALIEDLTNTNKIISFSTFVEDNQLCISVSNNGPMISKENIETIFENGFSTKKNNKEDHGLGLYIVKQLITKNNGEITVSSNKHETEFLIKFNMEKNKNGEFSPKHYQLNS
ncbi:GHKL domain-containing protein [Lutibacter sp. B2]|nr:GHKL domain-containing protein [Lutibacter sp. B2]